MAWVVKCGTVSHCSLAGCLLDLLTILSLSLHFHSHQKNWPSVFTHPKLTADLTPYCIHCYKQNILFTMSFTDFPLLTSSSNYFSHIIGWIVIFQQHIFLYTKLPSHKKKVYSVNSINEHLKTPRAVFWSSTWSCRLCLELGCFCRDFNIHLDNLQNPLRTAVVCILELLGVNQNTIGPTHYSRQTLDSILTFRLFIENIKYTITSVALHSFIELSQSCQLWFVHPLTSQSGDWVKILLHSK